MSDVLSLRQLNRATLARQLLLAREDVPVAAAVERLAGLQAQEPRPPFVGLWSRVERFRREQLIDALQSGAVVRATLMRATLHLAGAADYRVLRAALQPALSAAFAGVAQKDFAKGLDPDAVLPAARALLDEEPLDSGAIRARLSEAFPDVNQRALGYWVRTNLPLVMVPTDDRWGFPRSAAFALADVEPESDGAADRLALRYLAAFGPATAADFQTWSGLKGTRAVLERLGERLSCFEDEHGRTLFDLPDAPRPGADVPAPARFLPDFDNLLLAHSDRGRLVADEHRGALVTKNLRVRATFLVDGFVRGTWSIERKGKAATLAIAPFEKLPKRVLKGLSDEGEAMLRFAEEDATTLTVRVD